MPDPNESLIEAARRRPWFRLRLPGRLEDAFRAANHASPGGYLQSWLLVFVAFNLLSLKMDFDVFGPERFVLPALLTIGVFTPLTLAGIVALHGTPTAVRQAAVVIGTALVDMAVVLNSAQIAPPSHADSYRILAVVVPLVVGMIAPLSFRHCLVFCGTAFAVYVSYVVAFMLHGDTPTGLPLLIASLVLVPLKLAYSREWTMKETFLLTLEKARRDADLAAANARLTVLSETDSLTGLANRRSFTADMRAGWMSACEAGDWMAVALIDIDAFKSLNDTVGHLEGDLCLQRVAAALQRAAEAEGAGIVARYGGEEFGVRMPSADLGRARAIGERLRAAVAALGYPHPGLPGAAPVTVSVGVAAAHGGTAAFGIGVSDLLKVADDALYRAKRGGRDRVEAAILNLEPANSDAEPAIARQEVG